MTKILPTMAAVLLATACTQSPEAIQAEGEAAIRAQLRNPELATFERIRHCPNQPGIMGAVVTPEYGDTDGFGAFVYTQGEAVLLRSETSRYPELVRACLGE